MCREGTTVTSDSPAISSNLLAVVSSLRNNVHLLDLVLPFARVLDLVGGDMQQDVLGLTELTQAEASASCFCPVCQESFLDFYMSRLDCGH